MLTANRIHQFLNSAKEWDNLLRGQFQTPSLPQPRFAGDDRRVVIELDLPGCKRDSIEVHTEGKELSVKVLEASPDHEHQETWRIHEREHGERAFRLELPFAVEQEKTDIRYTDGVLRISIERPEKELPRKLEVK